MLTLEEELLIHLDAVVPMGDTRDRNIDLVVFFHGFGGETWPTLEETGQHFKIGTRERVRQIIARSFRERTGAEDLPELRACAKELSKHGIWFKSDFVDLMLERGWAHNHVNMRGVLNMMQGLGLCEDYSIYDSRIQQLARGRIDDVDDYLILNSESADVMKSAMREARSLPGLIGLANAAHLEDLDVEVDTIMAAIRLHPDSWIGTTEEGTYYTFEDRENVLINFSAKAFGLANKIEIARLAETFANALRWRSTKLSYPSASMIEKYIRGSTFFTCGKRMVRFEGELRELTPIEQDIVAYFEDHDTGSFVQLREHLVSMGYGIPLITKAVGTSPIVYVDRSAGRGEYVYSLVSHSKKPREGKTPEAEQDDRYLKFAARLQKIGAVGTDNTVESTARREQSILSQYLFEGRKMHRCAICGTEYGVGALLAAHKKKRSLCNERERLDPHIVMPLCVFGCDHLYERGLVSIVGSRVVARSSSATATGEKLHIDKIEGRKVAKEWLQGDPSYFR